MDSDNDERPRSYKRINLWSAGDTQLMLDLCGSYLFQIGPMKKFKNKKEMWAKISTRFPDKSPKQCEERFKTVLRRKNTRNDPLIVTAKKQQSKVQISNKNIKPEAVVQLSIDNNKDEYNECTNITVQETLWKIAENNEVANKRRHKENMEAMEKITLLQQILEDKWKNKLI